MEIKSSHNIKNTAVLKAFWQGIRPYKGFFFTAAIGYAVCNAIGIFIPLYYKRFFDILTSTPKDADQISSLTSILITILIINAIIWLCYRLAWFAHIRSSVNTGAKLKQIAFDYMMEHSYSFFSSSFTGSLVQRVNRFARAYDRISDRIMYSIIPLTVSLIGVAIVVWRIKHAITYAMIVWVLIFMSFNYFFSRWKYKYNVQMAAADSRSTAVLSDAVTNHSAIHLFTGMPFESRNYMQVNRDQAKISIFTWDLTGIVDAVQASLIFVVEFLIFYYAVRFWGQGTITIGVFVLLQGYLIGLGARLWDFSRIIRDFYEGFADAKEMVEIMTMPHEIKNLPGAQELSVPAGKIVFENVEFAFNQTRSVLNDISLEINSGEKIALIGPSGAGKSTFVRLILRIYETAAGKILIDDQDIKRVTQESLRKAIAFVPQDPVLFHRTLKDNIRYGRKEATDEEVIEAARQAHCDEFIKELPLGYDTFVGERGIKLSGGERQRVAIARALLKNAPILILDEATSSLDSHSESLIQDALNTLMKGRTTIVIAHRLSTIRKMDKIVVIEDGKIKESGTHQSLLENERSVYKKLWTLQAGGFLQETATE